MFTIEYEYSSRNDEKVDSALSHHWLELNNFLWGCIIGNGRARVGLARGIKYMEHTTGSDPHDDGINEPPIQSRRGLMMNFIALYCIALHSLLQFTEWIVLESECAKDAESLSIPFPGGSHLISNGFPEPHYCP